jgi:hypothetical protein
MNVISAIAVTVVLGIVMSASANSADVAFEMPTSFNGTGCPSTDSVAAVGAGTPTLSLLFGGFDSGKNAISGLARAACSFAIPIKVLRGFQVSHVTIDWEGFVQGQAELKRKFFLAGSEWMPWQINNFDKPDGDNFTLRDNLLHASFATGCDGGEYNLRVNSQIKTSENDYIAVDSADLNNQILLKINFEKC